APYRLLVELAEHPGASYQNTAQRGSRIDAHLSLVQKGWPAWKADVTGRTRPTIPGLSTYGASRIVLSLQRRDPKIERRLFDDAVDALVETIGHKLQALPAPAAPAS